jgi:hypothetical protein
MKLVDSIEHFGALIASCINELHGTKPISRHEELDAFEQAFIGAFLDDIYEQERERSREENAFDAKRFKLTDIDTHSLKKLLDDCKKFQNEHFEAIERGGVGFNNAFIQAGFDFYYTRTGAGVGFWETDDWPEPYSKELTDAAKKFGHIDGYVGDDKKVYVMGAEGPEMKPKGIFQGVSFPEPKEPEIPYSDGYEGDENTDADWWKKLKEGGAKMKPGEEHAGLTTDMKGRWTIGAFDTKKANKNETPVLKESQIPDPNVLLGIDHENKIAQLCAWCDKDKKITRHFKNLGYYTSHGICKHCTELMKRNAKTEGVIKLKSLLG